MSFGKFFVNFTNTHISLVHTVHHREIWSIVRGMVQGFVPYVLSILHPSPIMSQVLYVGHTIINPNLDSKYITLTLIAMPTLVITWPCMTSLMKRDKRYTTKIQRCHPLGKNFQENSILLILLPLYWAFYYHSTDDALWRHFKLFFVADHMFLYNKLEPGPELWRCAWLQLYLCELVNVMGLWDVHSLISWDS